MAGRRKKWRARQRPKTRDDCRDHQRPCPWVGCKWNLLIDVSHTGAIIFNLPGRGRQKITVPNSYSTKAGATFDRLEAQLITELERRRDQKIDTCMLDVQERDETITLEHIGVMMGLTRERIRQIELNALDDSHDSDELEEEREDRGVDLRGSKRGGGGSTSKETKAKKKKAGQSRVRKRRNRQ